MTKTVLALDLATASGWAMGPVGGKPTAGPLKLGDAKASPGERFAALAPRILDLCKLSKPDVVFIEKPLEPRVIVEIGARFETVELLWGLPAVAKAVLVSRGVRDIRWAAVQDVRQHFVGQRSFKAQTHPLTGKKITARAAGKAAVLNVCRLRGWQAEDDNVADALATWDYGCARLNPRLAHLATPLFRGS